MKTISITDRGEIAGTLTVSFDGLRQTMEGTCRDPGKLCRLAVICQGKRVPIGVMQPEAGRLSIRKSFTKNELHRLQVKDPEAAVLLYEGDETENCEVEKKETLPTTRKEHSISNGWKDAEDCVPMPAGETVMDVLKTSEGVLCRESDGDTEIAVPIEEKSDFSAIQLVSVGEVELIDGKEYLKVKINADREKDENEA